MISERVRHRAATGALLALTAGGHLPEVDDAGTAARPRDLVARPGRRPHRCHNPARTRRGDAVADPQEQAVPDALVGLAWPAVFACIGPVEGLLDLVHLDHRITVGTLPTEAPSCRSRPPAPASWTPRPVR